MDAHGYMLKKIGISILQELVLEFPFYRGKKITQLQPKLHGPHIAKNGWSSCKAIWRGSLGKLCFGKGR